MPWQTLPQPYALVQGTLYAAILSIPFYEKPLANEATITKKLQDAGFTGVQVDMSAGPRVEGTWSSPDDASPPLPSEIRTVWEWIPDPAPPADPDATADGTPAAG